jgi:hypothetical protein
MARVFISYAHESSEHRDAVNGLASWLIDQDIDVVSDHPYEDRPPEQGWNAWMEQNIEECDVVLVVCTPRLKARYSKREDPSVGRGAVFEGAIINQAIYDDAQWNTKFFPVVPDGGDPQNIPRPLRAFDNGHRFPSGNDRILRLILNKVEVPQPRHVVGAGSQRLSAAPVAGRGAPSPSKASLAKLTVRGIYSSEEQESERAWREISHRLFRRNFEVAADPVLDLLVENTSGGPLLFLKVGIRIVQRKPGTGGVMGYAQPIKVQAEYSVHCHEDWKRFNLHDDQSWASFPDPVSMGRDDSPFRATLRLENFCDTDSASLSEIRFCLETSSGTIESESIWLEQ